MMKVATARHGRGAETPKGTARTPETPRTHVSTGRGDDSVRGAAGGRWAQAAVLAGGAGTGSGGGVRSSATVAGQEAGEVAGRDSFHHREGSRRVRHQWGGSPTATDPTYRNRC